MEIFSTIKETRDCLFKLKKEGKTIGFVPTMGALHRGHSSLLERAKRENDISVASIFVNPIQFNDKKDLDKYPRTIEQDTIKLQSARCDVLFAPSIEEMYPASPQPPPSEGASRVKVSPEGTSVGWERSSLEGAVDLGNLDKVMEGKLRPGHFQGVCVVVKKLFDIVQPDKAYFGEKDFQQLAVIKHMVKTLGIPVEIVPCPTVREADGLAMSSRNAFLNPDERKNASLIYKTMMEAKEKVARLIPPHPQPLSQRRGEKHPTGEGSLKVVDLKKWMEEKINGNPFLRLEYFEIVNSETLMPVQSLEETKNLRACIAVKAGTIRLIDNIPL